MNKRLSVLVASAFRRKLLNPRKILPLIGAFALATPALAQPTREVAYNSRSVVRIDAKLRMTTMVILPESEEILDFVCGDKDYWVISGGQNLAYVKPAKAGATTNLNLVAASGQVYSFLLVEGSTNPDLKVYVTPDPATPQPTRKVFSATAFAEIEALKRQVIDANLETDRVRRDAEDLKRTSAREAQEAIDRFKAAYPMQLRFPYVFKARSKPFRVTAIYHDDRFTYIHSEAKELPAVYEVVDNVPNLIGFQVERGIYVIPKVLEHGYLAIGKQRLPFDVAGR
jgi:type IV secretion system protein VirB9